MPLIEAALIGAGSALVCFGGVLHWAAREMAWDGAWMDEGPGEPEKRKPISMSSSALRERAIPPGVLVEGMVVAFPDLYRKPRRTPAPYPFPAVETPTGWWKYLLYSGGMLAGWPVREWTLDGFDYASSCYNFYHAPSKTHIVIPYERLLDYARNSR